MYDGGRCSRVKRRNEKTESWKSSGVIVYNTCTVVHGRGGTNNNSCCALGMCGLWDSLKGSDWMRLEIATIYYFPPKWRDVQRWTVLMSRLLNDNAASAYVGNVSFWVFKSHRIESATCICYGGEETTRTSRFFIAVFKRVEYIHIWYHTNTHAVIRNTRTRARLRYGFSIFVSLPSISWSNMA